MGKFQITYYVDADSLEAAKKLAYVLLYLGDQDAEWVDVKPVTHTPASGRKFSEGSPHQGYMAGGYVTGSSDGYLINQADGYIIPKSQLPINIDPTLFD